MYCRLVVTATGFDGRLLHAAQQLCELQASRMARHSSPHPSLGRQSPCTTLDCIAILHVVQAHPQGFGSAHKGAYYSLKECVQLRSSYKIRQQAAIGSSLFSLTLSLLHIMHNITEDVRAATTWCTHPSESINFSWQCISKTITKPPHRTALSRSWRLVCECCW